MQNLVKLNTTSISKDKQKISSLALFTALACAWGGINAQAALNTKLSHTGRIDVQVQLVDASEPEGYRAEQIKGIVSVYWRTGECNVLIDSGSRVPCKFDHVGDLTSKDGDSIVVDLPKIKFDSAAVEQILSKAISNRKTKLASRVVIAETKIPEMVMPFYACKGECTGPSKSIALVNAFNGEIAERFTLKGNSAVLKVAVSLSKLKADENVKYYVIGSNQQGDL
jgi:hypothetical protein